MSRLARPGEHNGDASAIPGIIKGEAPASNFFNYVENAISEDTHDSDFPFLKVEDSDSPVLRFDERGSLAGAGGLMASANSEYTNDYDYTYLIPTYCNDGGTNHGKVKPAAKALLKAEAPAGNDKVLERTTSSHSISSLSLIGTDAKADVFGGQGLSIGSRSNDAKLAAASNYLRGALDSCTGASLLTAQQAPDHIARNRGPSTASSFSSSSSDNRRQSSYSSFSGGSSSTVDLGVVACGGPGSTHSPYDQMGKNVVRLRAGTTQSIGSVGSIASIHSGGLNVSDAKDEVPLNKTRKGLASASLCKQSRERVDSGESGGSARTAKSLGKSKRVASTESKQGNSSAEDLDDQLIRIIRSKMQGGLLNATDILKDVDSLVTDSLGPTFSSNDNILAKKAKRANYNNMSPEEEKAARDQSKRRRAAVKRRREKIRRTVINALFVELQHYFEQANDGVEPAQPARKRSKSHDGASTPKSKPGTPKGGQEEKEKKNDQAVILSKCLSIIRRLEHSHKEVLSAVTGCGVVSANVLEE